MKNYMIDLRKQKRCKYFSIIKFYKQKIKKLRISDIYKKNEK